eukprot:4103197-Pleurochrysis_carterae.AAC.1
MATAPRPASTTSSPPNAPRRAHAPRRKRAGATVGGSSAQALAALPPLTRSPVWTSLFPSLTAPL